MKEYFSHDYNARNDPRLVKLFMTKGLLGIGLYWCIIEMLYECNGYIMQSECERIAFELRTDCETIKLLISDFDLFKVDKKRFWSDSVIKRLNLRTEKSSKAKASALARWSNANALQTQSECNAIKVKEKKKKSKVNNIEFKAPEILEVENYFLENGYPKELAKRFFDSYSVADWFDSKGNKVKNWKQKAINVWFKPENKIVEEKQKQLVYR